MSEVCLTVREAGQDWSGWIHGSVADRAIAALSADPVTLAELDAAYARFRKRTPGRSFFGNLSAGFSDEPYDAGIVVIDLVARLIYVDSTYSSAGPEGRVRYHNGHCASDTSLPYHLAEDWRFTGEGDDWQGLAEQRRRELAARPLLETRSVFYGRPLLEFVARETFAAQARRETTSAEGRNAIKEIHAAWLLTPRDDLGGVCPRDVALARRNHLTWDLQDQAEHWSLLGICPPGLDESSFAFRHAGFGIHELVQYYELVRKLLLSCQERLVRLRETRPTAGGLEGFTVGDFLTSEVPRLESLRDKWFETPDPECHGRTPRSIINRERARLPEGMSAHDAMVDPDCPCCQFLSDLPGPAFWNLDCSGMDDDFAFDIYHRTREEWDEKQRHWEESSRRFNAEWEERKRLGVMNSSSGEPDEDSVWSSSFSVGETAEVPLGIRLFGIGCHLAELITDLRSDTVQQTPVPQAQQYIDRLNRDFGNLRELLQNSEPSLTEALIGPVIDRFTETLDLLASIRTDLVAKCESLTNSLARFLEPPSTEST